MVEWDRNGDPLSQSTVWFAVLDGAQLRVRRGLHGWLARVKVPGRPGDWSPYLPDRRAAQRWAVRAATTGKRGPAE